MRAFVWLLIAFSLGIGTGWLLGGDDAAPVRADRGPRSARVDSKTAASKRTQSTTSEPSPAHQDEVPSRSAPAGATSDNSAFALDPSWLGTLIIECDGERVEAADVSVYVMDMWGEEEAAWSEEELATSEQGVEVAVTSARYRLWPGDVRVVWSDVESRRVQVKIRAGETTTVRTDAPRVASEDPIPARLGRVVVSIRDLSGTPVAGGSFVLLGASGSGVEEETLELDGTGRTTLDLRPGPYRIVVGAQWRNVTIRAQQTVELAFQSQNEGEVEFVAPAPGSCWLQHVDGTENRQPYAFHCLAQVWRLLYVAPGTYDVFFRANGAELARNLGRVQVRARLKTKFRPSFPAGSVTLHFSGRGNPPNPDAAQLLSLDSDDPPRSLRHVPGFSRGDGDPEFRGTVFFLRLPPGRWRFKYSPRGFQSVTRVFEVADKPVEATIELRR